MNSDADLTTALLDSNITKITLGANIGAGPFEITRPLEIDLNGKNIVGTLNYNFAGAGVSKLSGTGIVNQVDVTTPLASFEQGAGVTITTLNLNNVARETYTNNGAITTANITDTDARFLNEGTASVGTLNVNTTGYVTLGGSSTLGNVVVKAATSVNVAAGTTVSDLQVNSETAVNNAGIISDLTGTGYVTLSGSGELAKVTNKNITVEQTGAADQSLTKGDGLVESGGVYSASFDWSSTNGVGTKLVEKSGRYNYFNDGAYLDITVKKDNGANVAFNTLFDAMTLQTDGGNIDEIQGTAGRQLADWTGIDTGFFTKLKVAESNSVFYGVRQTGQTTAVGMTRTVGFNAGDSRKIDLTLTPKANIATGTYTVTIQPKQQTGVTSGENLGDAITYEIVISE